MGFTAVVDNKLCTARYDIFDSVFVMGAVLAAELCLVERDLQLFVCTRALVFGLIRLAENALDGIVGRVVGLHLV